MILEKHERDKFALYCRRSAESCDAMAMQLAKSNIPAVSELLAKKERQLAIAFTLIAKHLESTEDVTVGE